MQPWISNFNALGLSFPICQKSQGFHWQGFLAVEGKGKVSFWKALGMKIIFLTFPVFWDHKYNSRTPNLRNPALPAPRAVQSGNLSCGINSHWSGWIWKVLQLVIWQVTWRKWEYDISAWPSSSCDPRNPKELQFPTALEQTETSDLENPPKETWMEFTKCFQLCLIMMMRGH